MLEIRLFGPPEVLADQRPVQVARRKTRALLYYLAARQDPVQRDQLLAFFWPDTPRPAAQQVLRTTLHGLRQALGPALLSIDDRLGLDPAVQVDARQFEQQLDPVPADTTSLAAALDLYRGDFLEGFSLPDSSAFEDWLLIEREHYRRLAVRGLAELSRQYEAWQDFPSALASLDRALESDPLQEDLQRESIRLLYLGGDRPGAIRRYDQLRRLLDEEMGVPPMAETRDLYDAIVNDRLLPSSPGRTRHRAETGSGRSPGASPVEALLADLETGIPFTGREAELRAIEAGAAAHKLVWIEGEAGIGKTRLAAEYLRNSGTLALVGASRELEQSLPYQPLIEALRGLVARPDWPERLANLRLSLPRIWLSETAHLVPELAGQDASPPASRPADESRLWEGLHQFLRALAQQEPVTLFLDDLHWADASTLGLLGYLVRQSAGIPLRLIAAARRILPRTPAAALVQSLTREGRLAAVPLARLDPEEITQISRQLSPAYTFPLAGWLTKNSEGNPFVLVELVRYARENRLMQADGEMDLSALSTTPVVPQNVYSLIQARMERLSDPARRFLSAAVAAGREFEFDVVNRAAGLSETAGMDALAELRLYGVIHPTGDVRYAFDHSLTMEVAYREVGEPRHRLLHRRIAEAMESTYGRARLAASAGVIAWHFSEGHAPDRAAPYAFQAGKQAAHLAAWAEAAAFFEQALEGIDPTQRFEVLMALGNAYFQVAQMMQAYETFHQAVELAQDHPEIGSLEEAQLAVARTFLFQMRFDEAIRAAQRVLETGRPEYAVTAHFIWGTALSLEGADLEEAARHLTEANSLCRAGKPEDPTLEAQIPFELGSIAAQQGELPKAIELYQASLEIACQPEDERFVENCALAHNNLAYHLLLLGENERASEHAQAGLALSAEKGLLRQETYLFSTAGEIALAQGDLDAAERYFNQGLDLARRLSMGERVAGLTANLGLAALQRGQQPLAIHRLSVALAEAETVGTQHLAAQIRLWLIPLLPAEEARGALEQVRGFAQSGGRRRLLEQVHQLEKELSPP